MSPRSDTAQDEFEVVDGEPVLDERAPVRAHAAGPSPAAPPAGALSRRPSAQVAQAAAVAVTGFAAGALATAVVRRAKAGRKPAPRRVTRGNDRDVLATRTFLVDVHLLGSRD